MTKLHEEWREEAQALKALADLGDNRSWYEGKALGLLDCADELEAALAEQGWRRVADDPPPKDRAILIWQPTERWPGAPRNDDPRYAIGYWRGFDDLGEQSWGNRNSVEVSFTHWMPLPPAPGDAL